MTGFALLNTQHYASFLCLEQSNTHRIYYVPSILFPSSFRTQADCCLIQTPSHILSPLCRGLSFVFCFFGCFGYVRDKPSSLRCSLSKSLVKGEISRQCEQAMSQMPSCREMPSAHMQFRQHSLCVVAVWMTIHRLILFQW